MKLNPVFKREIMVSSRSIKIVALLMVFNGILSLVAFLNMYATVMQMKMTAEVQYSNFLELYMFVSSIEFLMVVFLVPATTSGSISGERERQTLDLLLLTGMSPAEIVIGKLAASLTTIFMLVISSFPVLSLVFVYGGVTLTDLFVLLICYGSTAIFIGSMGVCFSAYAKKTVVSTVLSYGVLAFTVFGTYGINYFILTISRMQMGSYASELGMVAEQTSTEGFIYLLLLNPAASFYSAISQQVGSERTFQHISQWFGVRPENIVFENWTAFGIIIQLLFSALFIWFAVRALDPQGKKYLQ